MAKNDGGAAFPRPVSSLGDPDMFRERSVEEQEGMTLLDYFAGKAMEATLLRMDVYSQERLNDQEWLRAAAEAIAHLAYIFATAMLAARVKV